MQRDISSYSLKNTYRDSNEVYSNNIKFLLINIECIIFKIPSTSIQHEPMDTHSESRHSIIQPIEFENSLLSNSMPITNKVRFWFFPFPLCGMRCYFFFYSMIM